MSTLLRQVLLVEDNMIIAMDTEDMLQQLGAQAVTTASSVAMALDMIAKQRPDFALLDIKLGMKTSFEIAELLTEMGVPFAFTSGYGDQMKLPAPFDRISKLHKPYSIDDLRDLIGRIPGPAGG